MAKVVFYEGLDEPIRVIVARVLPQCELLSALPSGFAQRVGAKLALQKLVA